MIKTIQPVLSIAAVVSLLFAPATLAEEGMWTPAQMPELGPRLASAAAIPGTTSGSADRLEFLDDRVLVFTSAGKKREIVMRIWQWSGEDIDGDHPMLTNQVLGGIYAFPCK